MERTLVSVSAVFLVSCAVLGSCYKCCESGRVLMRDVNDTFYCATPAPYIGVVKLRVAADHGFPTGCPVSDLTVVNISEHYLMTSAHCVDKLVWYEEDNQTVSSQVVGLMCANDTFLISDSSNTSLWTTTVIKCCPEGLIYDSSKRTCVNMAHDDDFLDRLANHVGVVNFDYSGLECQYQVMVDILGHKDKMTLLGNGELWTGKKLLKNGTYCVDSEVFSGNVVRYCTNREEYCKDNVCVTKCCPNGKSIVGRRCQPSFETFSPNFHSSFRQISEPSDFGIIQQMPCLERFPLRPDQDVYDKSYLQPNGELFVPIYGHMFDDSKYCMEHVNLESAGMNGTYTFLCFTMNFTQTDRIPYILRAIGLITSCIFLLLTLLVYGCLPSLQNLHGKTLMCHVSSVLAAFVFLTILQLGTYDKSITICKIIGFLLVFTLMAAFSWLNVMCFDIWWTFGAVRSIQRDSRRQSEKRQFIWYSVYAWGMASLLGLWTILMNEIGVDLPEAFQPSIGHVNCFLMLGTAARLVFYVAPMSIQIGINLVFYVMTAWHCSKVKAEIHRLQSASSSDRCKKRYQADKAKLLMNIKLFVVMGIMWVTEITSNLIVQPAWMWYLSDAANALQGLLIFIIFVLKRKILARLAKRLGINLHPVLKMAASTHNSSSSRCYDPYRVRKTGSSSTLCTSMEARTSNPSSPTGNRQQIAAISLNADRSAPPRPPKNVCT